MVFNQKQSESGRSMVEMLGVLAVVGVLSLAGIFSYQMAINYGKANTVVNDINTLYMASLIYKQNQTSWVAADFATTTLYPITVQVGTHICASDNKTCRREMSVSGVPFGACARLKLMLDGFTGTCDSDDNTLSLGLDTLGHFTQIKEN